MVPAQRRELGNYPLIECRSAPAHRLDDATQIAAVEQDDGGGDEVKGGCAAGLVFVSTVPETTKAVESHGSGERVLRFALVEFGGDKPAELGILKPAQGEQRALDAPDFAQRGGQTVLLPVSAKFLQDERRCHHPVPERLDYPLNILPVCPDQPGVEAMAEQRRQWAVPRFRLERVEFAIRQARDTGFEGKSEQVHDGEDDVRRATTIDMKCCDVHAALVTEDAVQ